MRNGIRRLSIMAAVVGAALSLTGAPAHAARLRCGSVR